MPRTTTIAFLLLAAGGLLVAQAPPPSAPATAKPAATEAPTPTHADMNQLMRGVLYPPANVVFSSQVDDPATVETPPGVDPAMSPNPLASAYGGWIAVENAALALAESASLMSLPGRRCSNGAPAPTSDPLWVSLMQQVRDAGMQAYKAAQARSQDQLIEASNALNNTCEGCHRRWRNRRAADRCK